MSGIGRRLYLIRHGKADRRSSGETVTIRGTVADPPLDATGREQASMLATRLRKMPEPAAIYCSTLARARQTIEPFVEATGAQVTYAEDLVEWFGGAWEFKEFEELLVEHPEIPRRILLQDPVFHLAPGGEPFDGRNSPLASVQARGELGPEGLRDEGSAEQAREGVGQGEAAALEERGPRQPGRHPAAPPSSPGAA